MAKTPKAAPELIPTTPAPQQAPDTPTGANDDSDGGVTVTVKPSKKQQAKHELLDSAGALVDEEEKAHGIRYTLLANGQTFEWRYGQNPDADRMLAIFGAKTMATNETSAARNSPKGEASPDEQMDAVRERFELIGTGVWVDRTREGVKIDPDALAEAITRVVIGEGKIPQSEFDTYKANRLAKINGDKKFATVARTNAKVAAEYATIVGRKTASVDDLLA